MSSRNDQSGAEGDGRFRRNESGMDFEGHLKSAWLLAREEPVFVLGGGLLAQFLLMISFGLLAGPLGGAYLQVLLDALRGRRRPRLNDLVSGLGRFGGLFPYFFLVILTILGFFFFIVPGVFFVTWWLYALPLMVDKGLSLGAAMGESKALVARKGFFLHLVFIILLSVVPSMILQAASAVLPPLAALHLLFFPFQSVCLASLYLEQFEGRQPGGSSPSCTPQPPSPPGAGDNGAADPHRPSVL